MLRWWYCNEIDDDSLLAGEYQASPSGDFVDANIPAALLRSEVVPSHAADPAREDSPLLALTPAPSPFSCKRHPLSASCPPS